MSVYACVCVHVYVCDRESEKKEREILLSSPPSGL